MEKEWLVWKTLFNMDKGRIQNLTYENYLTLIDFDDYNCKELKLKETTRMTQLKILVCFAMEVMIDFKSMGKKHIKKYFDSLTVAPYTIEHRRLIIVKFFKWFFGLKRDAEPPEVVGWLEPDKDAYDKIIKPSSLLNDEEVKRLVEACDNYRDKAFIMTIYDSGARIGELMAMNIEDVEFEGDICYIFLPESKTEKRRVGLIYAVPYLKTWIDNHPYKNNLKHPLWISFSGRSYGQRLGNSSTFEALNNAKKRAGIDKKINNHIFRHSSISKERKLGMKDVFIRRRHGLAPGSMVLERYTWVEDKDAFNDYRQAMGMEPLECVKEDPEILKPLKCICGVENPCDAKFCFKCRLPLNYEAVERDINILEMFKTKFAKFSGVNIDTMLGDYQKFKAETSDMQKVLDCFDNGHVVNTAIVRKNLGLKDDDALELLQFLMGVPVIDILGDKVILLDRKEFENFIKMQKHYLERKT